MHKSHLLTPMLSAAKGLNIGLNPYLHPYLAYVSSKSVHLHRLASAFIA